MRFYRWLCCVLLFFLGGVGLAQQASKDAAADAVAEATVKRWLAGEFETQPPPGFGTSPEAFEKAREVLLKQLRFGFAPRGKGEVGVSYDLRKLLAANETRRVYAYPVVAHGSDYALGVELRRVGGVWQAHSLRLNSNDTETIPAWVGTPGGVWFFLAFSAMVVFFLVGASDFRHWFLDSWRVTTQHKSIYGITNVVLYGVFVLGMVFGALEIANAPAGKSLTLAFQEVMANSLAETGIAETLRGGPINLAFGIFYNNFFQGAFFTTFVPGLLFAVFAYIVNIGRYFILGVGLTPAALPLLGFVFHIPTMIVELQAYIFVTAGAGIMVARVLRQQVNVGVALRDYGKTLAVAAVLLLMGAWYESISLSVIVPWLSGK